MEPPLGGMAEVPNISWEASIMTVQTEVFGKTFDEAFEGFQKAAESTLHFQRQLFRQWVRLWPGMPKPSAEWAERVQQFHKEWTQTATELARKYQQSWDAQYKTGIRLLTEAFKTAECSSPEQLREKTEELWRQAFDCFKKLAQAQARDFQDASEKWIGLMTRANAEQFGFAEARP
jgi:hypothetical protein